MAITVFELCEQAIGLIRGKRLILTTTEHSLLDNLNYDGLTAAHAQDEAIVCALHFERVRDRLLQIYPWVFARAHKTYSASESRVLPSDCLTLLCVLKDGEPLEYEGNAIPSDADEVIYTQSVVNWAKWPPIFRDVFVYSLAIEICPAVTGKPEYTQLLEQKVQELIHRAHQIGAIKAETRLTLKDELYNRAIGLSRGQRSLKTTSAGAVEQGIDNAGFVNDRMTAEYQACVRASDSVRDRLLGLYAWSFARKSAVLTTTASTLYGWKYAYELPKDCLRVLDLHSHSTPFDGASEDFEEAGNVVYSNELLPEIRYTARVEDMSSWPGIFADVYCYSLAQEIVLATTGNADTIQLLEAKVQSLIQEAHRIGEIKADVKIPAGEELYNRAIGLVRGQRTIAPDGRTASGQGIDIAGDVNYREQ